MTAFARASLKTSTYNQYRRLWERFAALASARGYPCLPVSTAHFEQLLSDFAASSKSASSSQKLVAAVSFFHRYYGFEPPATAARGRLILRGITRTFTRPVQRAPPLTPEIIRAAVYHQIGSDLQLLSNFVVPLSTWRTVAQLVLSFSTLARFHCLANISVKDMIFINGGAHLTFWHTKTDALNQGQSVFIAGTTSFACPVRFLQAYVYRLNWEACLGGFFPFSGPLFPALVAGSPSLRPDAAAFSKQAATISMRHHLLHLGVPNAESFTLHSGRRGGATQAAIAGCDFLTIKRQGRWASDSCPQMYIDDAATMQSNFTSFLGL